MQGYLIEFNFQSHSWSWNKWEYQHSTDGMRQVIRQRGGLEFMKMFHSLVDGATLKAGIIQNQKQMDAALKKFGTEYIFLYQGETILERDFQTVEEAETFYQLEECPIWDLTDYWFAYDGKMESWCMFDASTGDQRFTPASKERQLRQQGTTTAAVNRFTSNIPGNFSAKPPAAASTERNLYH